MKLKKILFLGMIASLLATSCGTTSTVPLTGRKHRLLVDDASMLSLSGQEYQQYMSKAKKSTNVAATAMVTRVGQKLANSVENYLRANGFANEVKNFQWEFNLVQSSEVNAFCMPGGKIVVMEGILPVTKDETSLAIVLGHEIAHAVAKHSAEQYSKKQRSAIGLQAGASIMQIFNVDDGITQLSTDLAAQGLTLLNLKFSRNHESEADRMGLVFAAMAGYDPNAAVAFWQRMASAGSSTTPSWLRTHPTDAQRISDIQKKYLPEALRYYKK